MKHWRIEETITVTETTEYVIEAKTEKEALEKFRQEGENLGSCSTDHDDGVVIWRIENESI